MECEYETENECEPAANCSVIPSFAYTLTGSDSKLAEITVISQLCIVRLQSLPSKQTYALCPQQPKMRRCSLALFSPARAPQHVRFLSSSSSSSRVWRVDDPYTGDVLEVPLHSASQTSQLLQSSHSFQTRWSTSSLQQRQQLCTAFADLLASNKQRIAADITRQMGKPISQALGEVDTCVARARSLVAQSEVALAAISPLSVRSGTGPADLVRYITKEPVGVVLSLCPWNYPLLCAVNSVVPAVLAGCTVLLKHSDRTPLAAEAFSSLFQQAGADPSLVQHLHIDHDQVAQLVSNPHIGYVQFTGSVGGGRAVYKAVANSRFIDVGLELGGKDAAYVAADADLSTAVGGVVEGALYNAGQSCCAVERVYVHRSIADKFIASATAIIQSQWKPGNPHLPDTQLGPVAQPHHIDTILPRIKAAVRDGARLLSGGEKMTVDGKGRFLSPTFLVHCQQSSDIVQEETFGPVLPLVVVDSDEQAIQHINDSRYGLTASVWTTQQSTAERVGQRLNVGTVYANRCDVLDPELTWSGRRDSGKGFGLGELGFLPFIRSKSYNMRIKQK